MNPILKNSLKLAGSVGVSVLAEIFIPGASVADKGFELATGSGAGEFCKELIKSVSSNFFHQFANEIDYKRLLNAIKNNKEVLNHDIEKLMMASLAPAIKLLEDKYFETYQREKSISHLFEQLKTDAANKPFSSEDYQKMVSAENEWLGDIKTHIFTTNEYKIPDEVSEYFKNHFQECYRLIFIEGLKNPQDEKPLKAFLIKTLTGLEQQTQELKKEILDEIKNLQEDKRTNTLVLSQKHFEEIHSQLTELLNINRRIDKKIDIIIEHGEKTHKGIDSILEIQNKNFENIQELLNSEKTKTSQTPGNNSKTNNPWRDIFSKILHKVLPTQIELYPESKDVYIEYLKKNILYNKPLIDKIEKKGELDKSLNQIIDSSNYSKSIFGLSEYEASRLKDGIPIVIEFPPTFLGVASILFYLRDVKGFKNLNFDFSSQFALEIGSDLDKKVKTKLSDFVVLGNGPSTIIYKHNNYNDLGYKFEGILLPCPQKFVGPSHGKPDLTKEITLVLPSRGDILSTPEIQRQILNEINENIKKLTQNGRIKIIYDDPNNAKECLKKGYYVIVWEPIISYLEEIGVGKPIPSDAKFVEFEKFDTLLFSRINENMSYHDIEAISRLIFSITHFFKNLDWGHLELKKGVDAMLNDENYLISLARCCGANTKDFVPISGE